jgi:hypothetical protein
MGKESEMLLSFLDNISEDLEVIVTRWDFLIYKDLRDQARSAWYELKKSEVTANVKQQLLRLDENDLKVMELIKIGLWGKQLEWKIFSYIYFRNRFLDDHGQIWKKCKQMLKWADVILGTLTVAFPPLELLKEFKEGIEASLNK